MAQLLRFSSKKITEIFEQMELVFCDTGCEIPETCDYLNKIEIYLNKKIVRISHLKVLIICILKIRFYLAHLRNIATKLKIDPFKTILKICYQNISQ